MADMQSTMQTLSAVMPMIGGAFSANAMIDQGEAIQTKNYWEAYQLDLNADKAMASASVDVESMELQFDLAASRARAVAGGQGTGLDGQVADIIANMAGVGRYEMDKIIFSGQDAANRLNTQASFKRFEGKQARKGANYTAGATALAGVSQGAVNWFGGSRYINKQLVGSERVK